MNCPALRYLETPEFLRTAAFYISFFSIPVNLSTTYIICFHTPTSMKRMKPTLLNAQIWASISDFTIGTLTVPFLFFPFHAGVPNGLLNYLGIPARVQSYLASCMLSEVGACVILVLEAQQRWICGSNAVIDNKRLREIVLSLNYVISFIFLLPMYWTVPDQMATKLNFLSNHPCANQLLLDDSVYSACDDLLLVSICYCSCLCLFFPQGLIYISNSSYHLYLSTATIKISQATRHAQKTFFIAVCLQVILPTVFLAVPVGYFVFSMTTAINNCAFLLLSAHGCFNSVCTILIYEKYRSFVKRKILCYDCAPKVTAPSNTSIGRHF